jgi:predicted outer membrane protein
MHMFTKPAAVVAALGLALVLSACGEKKVTSYEPGKYSGAPVAAPWDSPQYSGKQADWEAALQARAQSQNDYARIK